MFQLNSFLASVLKDRMQKYIITSKYMFISGLVSLITDSSAASKEAKDWLSREISIPSQDITVLSSAKTGSLWSVVLSAPAPNGRERYSLMLSSDGNVVKFSRQGGQTSYGSMGSAPSMVLIALIFSLISVIGSAIAIIVLLIISFVPSPIAFLFPLFLVDLVVSIYILTRINKMRNHIDAGDPESAFKEDTIALGVLALFLNGLIPGILLLLARDQLRRAFDVTP